MAVKTNDLKKGTQIRLQNGWEARIEDNARGNRRMCTVYGDFTEMGSVYSHDIVSAEVDGEWVEVEHTDSQIALRSEVAAFFSNF